MQSCRWTRSPGISCATSPTARRSERERSSPPPARTIESCRSKISRATRWPASTTQRPSSRRCSAQAAPRSSSAAGTQPGRPRCSSPRRRRRCASSYAARSPRRCRATWSIASRHTRGCRSAWSTAVTGLHGDPLLERVTLTGPEGTVEADCTALFSFIGAEPNSGWLGSVTVDEHGFVLTDRALDADALGEEWATSGRLPLPYETSRPGLFAVGDLRAGSTKRVAAAVGEGSASIRSIHEHLAFAPAPS